MAPVLHGNPGNVLAPEKVRGIFRLRQVYQSMKMGIHQKDNLETAPTCEAKVDSKCLFKDFILETLIIGGNSCET